MAAKWQKEFQEKIEGLNNRDLLEAFYEASQPDGYDGFTNRGSWRLEALKAELEQRLDDWLTNNEM